MLLFKREKEVSRKMLDPDWLRGDEEALDSLMSIDV